MLTRRTLLSSKLVLVLLLLGSLPGCRHAPSERQRATTKPPTPATSPAPTAAPSAAATVDAAGNDPDAAVPDAGKAREPAVHCKARGKRALALLGTVRGRVMGMEAHEGNLFLLHFEEDLRRASLTRIARDGSSRQKISHHDGPSEPKSFMMTSDAAYFTRKTHVIRMSLSSGEAKEVIHGFAEAITVAGDFVYGVSCGSKGAIADTLVRVSLVTGSRESFAELPHVPTNKRASSSDACDYHFLAVDGDTVFISDWAGRRILSASLRDKSMSVVTHAGSYPMRITLEPETIVYQAEGGLYRVPRAGGESTRLADLANTPFTNYAYDGLEYWINQSVAYTDEVWIYRLGQAAANPHKVLKFKGYKDCSYPCEITDGIAVDDECLYVAHCEEHSDTLFAWPKN